VGAKHSLSHFALSLLDTSYIYQLGSTKSLHIGLREDFLFLNCELLYPFIPYPNS
jgi:hypothetical protein